MVDMVVHRHEMRATLSRLVHMLMKKPKPKTRSLPQTISATATRSQPAKANGANGRPTAPPIHERCWQPQQRHSRPAAHAPSQEIDLVLDRIQRLLAGLGHPERKLPPVIHVAGTNGKGSTCAFARAMLEAQGLKVHVYTSPHLVRFHERIRLAGKLIGEDELVATLDECERVNAGAPITFFEITTAAAVARLCAPSGRCAGARSRSRRKI